MLPPVPALLQPLPALLQPLRLAAAEGAGDTAAGPRLDAVLGVLILACRTLAAELAPFVPDLAARVAAACDDSAGRLPAPRTLFPRIGLRPGRPRLDLT